ncbi:hypothetical protein HC766_03855 [Candidatus Gracilibacteria bacterium]|nr:hypothetical protein [Candidatus Gracilibacteria bacterium]
MQIINDKFVTFLAQKKAGLGATSSNESIKDAIRGSKYACISNAPAKKSNCHINLLFDQLKQQQWSFVGKNSEAIPTSKSSNYSQAK